MNIGNMAKSMNDVERYSPISVGDSYCPCADMDTDPDGEWVSYAAYATLQQQLAAAREALQRFVDDAENVDLGGGDAVVTTCESLEAAQAYIATLQRDRQP